MKCLKTPSKLIACILIIILSASCFTACGTSASFSEHIMAGNYEDAINLYRNKLSGNSEKERDAKDFLSEYLQGAIDGYADGTIDEHSAQSKIDCLLKIDDELHILNIELGRKIEEFTMLQISKENYEKAVEMMLREDYESALMLFAEVRSLDTQNYESAQEQMTAAYDAYKAEITAAVNELIGKKEFELARQKAEAYGDILAGDKDYEALCVDLIDAWEIDVVHTAAEIFGEDKDYESAIRFLELSGLQNNVIDAEIARYQEYIPIYLSELEYTKKTKFLDIGSTKEPIMTDLQKNIYDGTRLIYPADDYNILWAPDRAKTEDEAYVDYYLNAEYSRLTGTLYVPYKSLSCSNEWTVPTTVKIYGDKALLFEAPSFTTSTIEPLPIEIDITGVRELRIVMLGVWIENTSGDVYYSYPKVCAADLCISK